jgi:hypothetical protein
VKETLAVLAAERVASLRNTARSCFASKREIWIMKFALSGFVPLWVESRSGRLRRYFGRLVVRDAKNPATTAMTTLSGWRWHDEVEADAVDKISRLTRGTTNGAFQVCLSHGSSFREKVVTGVPTSAIPARWFQRRELAFDVKTDREMGRSRATNQPTTSLEHQARRDLPAE